MMCSAAVVQMEVVLFAGVLVGFLVVLSLVFVTVILLPGTTSSIVMLFLSPFGWISLLVPPIPIQLISLSPPFLLPALLLALSGGLLLLPFFDVLMWPVIRPKSSLPILLRVPFG